MRILEGTPQELIEYQRLQEEAKVSATADPLTVALSFIRENHPPEAVPFGVEFVRWAVEELALRPTTGPNKSTYVRLAVPGSGRSRGAVVYVPPSRVDFKLDHPDVADIADKRMERKDVKSDFRVAIRRQTVKDVKLAIELARRAVEKARTADN